MARSRTVLAALLAVGLTPVVPRAQDAPQARASQAITATATAILVDVVVRDSKGRLVTDLTADDFRVREDGVGQRVDSFMRVSRGNGIGVGVAWKSHPTTMAVTPPEGAAAAASPASGGESPSTTAIVFDHLTPETLRLAQRATLAYVPMSGESETRIGIFATDPGVRLVQPYTTDRPRVRAALDRIVPSGSSTREDKAERADTLLARRRELLSETASATGGGASGQQIAKNASVFGQRDSELQQVQMELNMIRSFDALDRGQQGYDTWRALQTVINTLKEYPGRKTLVFFSEGLPVTPVLSARLDGVIDAANRANVTTYAIDANGLHATSTLTNARKEVDAFSDERFLQLASGSDRTDQPLTMGFERVEDTLTLDSRTGLARLSGDTGGFLIEGSNDLSSAFKRIDEDTRFHYLLTYSPANTSFDGKFRHIDVDVKRSGAQVFARKGYRALRAPGILDKPAFETPALALLDRAPLPNAFPVYAAGFTFPDPLRPGLTPVVVRVATDALRFVVDEDKGTYSAQVAIVVRLKGPGGEDLQTLSQQYVFSGGASDLEAARSGEILFYREADLGPGVYTMETVVLDAAANRASARVATLTVPEAGLSAVGMSSLVLVNRVEDVPDAPTGDAARTAPLYVGHTLLYPNVGEPIRRHDGAEVPFYFEMFGSAQDATATAELLRAGRVVASAPLALAPTAGPRLQHVGRLPVGTLPAGAYELRIRVMAGGRELSRAAWFTLKD